MALVYPICIDNPMMTAFLASLEGGLIEETSFEDKSADGQEKTKTGSLSAKVAGLFSNVIDFEGKGEMTRKATENLESQYKGTVRFPSATLFIRLRDLLFDQDLIKVIDSKTLFSDIATGDLVEFEGVVLPNPAYQMRHIFKQLLPFIEIHQKLQDSKVDQFLALIQNAKPGKPVLFDNEEKIFQDQAELASMRDVLKAGKQSAQNQLVEFQTIGQGLEALMPEDHMDNLVFKTENIQAVCRVYPAYARDERVQDIHDAKWRCLGKVIGIVSESGSYDLLKGSPIGYLAQEQFSTVATSFNNDQLKIELTDPSVKGPAIIIAPLAIFA